MKLLTPERIVKWEDRDTGGWETGRVLLNEYGMGIYRNTDQGQLEVLVQLTYGGVAFIRDVDLQPGYVPVDADVPKAKYTRILYNSTGRPETLELPHQ